MVLYLIATPIGNLGDLSARAIQTIELCDYLLCEDTRHSRKLLNHYELKNSLKSYHKFNEAARQEEVLADLEAGKNIGLLSDAGTPGISDPGVRLVAAAQACGLPVTALPGPCAAIVALSLSGLPSDRFQFVGFLPKKKGKQTLLKELLTYPGTSICFESPHRIEATLKQLVTLAPTRQVAIARELTKKFEQLLLGTPEELLEKAPFRGEIVLLIPSA